VRGSEAAGMGKCVDGCMDAWMHGCMAAWLHGCMAAWMHGLHGCMDAWVNDSIVTNCEMELSGIE